MLEEYYLGWLNQLEDGLKHWSDWSISGVFRGIIVAGMGGSGIVGDYLSALSLVNGGLPVITVKHYMVPGFVGSSDLAVVISYSGNTLETRLFYESVRKRGAGVVVVSSDGLLEEYARRDNVLFLPVVKGIAPRTALPHMLYRILGLLDSSGISIVSRDKAKRAYDFLTGVMEEATDKAYDIASFIHENKGLLILATHSPLEPLAWRVKNEFNENSKIPVKVEAAPEWMHNDIVGWEKPYENKYTAILVSDPSDRVGSRLVDYMEKIYKENSIPTYRLLLKGETLLEKLLYGSLVFGLASVRLARIRGLDPLKTTSIVEYKKVVDSIFK